MSSKVAAFKDKIPSFYLTFTLFFTFNLRPLQLDRKFRQKMCAFFAKNTVSELLINSH